MRKNFPPSIPKKVEDGKQSSFFLSLSLTHSLTLSLHHTLLLKHPKIEKKTENLTIKRPHVKRARRFFSVLAVEHQKITSNWPPQTTFLGTSNGNKAARKREDALRRKAAEEVGGIGGY